MIIPNEVYVDLFDLPAKRLQQIPDDHWINSRKIPIELQSFLSAPRRLLIVVNDVYRPTPTSRIMKALTNYLDLNRTRILVATGVHPPAKAFDPKLIFGDQANKLAGSVTVHDAFDESALVTMGTTGSQAKLNRLLGWCEAILIIGSVEPHYFAGFTGGRKIILPGCASFGDVEQNHAFAINENSQPLRRKGNPVWEDIQKRTAVVDSKDRFAIQVVCDHDQKIYFQSHGDWDESYNHACQYVLNHYAHRVKSSYDIVVSVVYPPLDRNLYQLQKSFENVAQAVNDGGTIFLLSACNEGVGDERFLKIAESSDSSESVSHGHGENLMMGIHKVTRTRRLAERLNLLLCSTLDPGIFRNLPIKAADHPQSAINKLISKYGNKCRIAVVLDAASQVLYTKAA